MPQKSSMGKLRHRIFRRRSASVTKINELGDGKEETENESKNVASSSKTWTSAMGKSLRRKLSAFRKDIDENESPFASKPVPDRVNVIYLRKPSSVRNGVGLTSVRFASADEMVLHHRKREQFHSSPGTPNSRFGADFHLQINPESELNYARLMQFNACYEAMPTSSKMVVFDTKLQLKKAFNGLIYQNTRHVLLSDASSDNAIVGILSVTDFIRVLLRLHKMKKELRDKEQRAKLSDVGDNSSDKKGEEDSGKGKNESADVAITSTVMPKEDIGTLTISEYRDLIRSEGELMDLVSITAEDSLLKAAQLLSKHRIHRLPVMDPYDGSPLFILTHKRILKFLWLFGQSLSIPDHHRKTCKELGVGTFDGIRVVYPDTSLTLCLDILLNKGVSGVPVVEHKTFRVVDMYSRFDAIGVALEDKIDELDVTVQDALAFRNTFRQEKDRVVSIEVGDSLWTAMTVLVERNVHRLCVLKDNGAIEGLISLSDVINYLVVKAAEKLSVESPHHSRLSQHTQHSSLSILQEGREPVADLCDSSNSSTAQPQSGASGTRRDGSAGSLEEQHGAGGISKQFAAFSMD